MAIYTASLSVGFAAGPLMLSLIGVGNSGYVIGAAIAALAIIPIANRSVMAPAHMEPATARPYQYFGMAPVAIAATMLNAGVEAAGLSFLAIYAAGLGWSEQQGVQLVSMLMVGAIVLQLPIGWLADRMDRRRLILLLSVISAIGARTWPYMLAEPWMAYAAVFVWGGLFVGIYTVTIAEVGSRFSGGDLVGIYAVMGFGWGGGALIGPIAAGPAMDASPSYGLPFVIASGCAAFAAFLLIRRSRA
jgi:MFS family permease